MIGILKVAKMEALSLLYDICVCQLPKFNKKSFEVFAVFCSVKLFDSVIIFGKVKTY